MSISLSNKPLYIWYYYHDSWTFVRFQIFSFILFIRRPWVYNFERTVYFMQPIVLLSVVIADILSAYSWTAVERLTFFPNVFGNTKNQKQTYFWYYLMLPFHWSTKNRFEMIAKPFHSWNVLNGSILVKVS